MTCDCGDESAWVTGNDAMVVCTSCGVVVDACPLDDSAPFERQDEPRPRPSAGAKRARPEQRQGVSRRVQLRCGAPEQTAQERAAEASVCAVNHAAVRFRLDRDHVVAQHAAQLMRDYHASRRQVCAVNRPALVAAALYFGFSFAGADRELRAVSATLDVPHHALLVAVTNYQDALGAGDRRLFAGVRVGRLLAVSLDRLAAAARMDAATRGRVWGTAHRLAETLAAADCGRKPRTVCCGLLWLAVADVGAAGVTKQQVCDACDVCPPTLDKVAQQLRPDTCATTEP